MNFPDSCSFHVSLYGQIISVDLQKSLFESERERERASSNNDNNYLPGYHGTTTNRHIFLFGTNKN